MKTVGTRREGVGYDHRLAARFQMLARTIPVMAAPPARIPTPEASAEVPSSRLIEGKGRVREGQGGCLTYIPIPLYSPLNEHP
jgi:hypothetical protein